MAARAIYLKSACDRGPAEKWCGCPAARCGMTNGIAAVRGAIAALLHRKSIGFAR